MKATRAVAGLLLLALFLGTTLAGGKCANCGLGEGVDACNCGNSVIRSEKLEKPEVFASPEAIKDALKLKAASAYAARQTAPVYVLPTYDASYAVPAVTYGVAYNAVPAPSPVSYVSLTPPSPPALSPLLRGKNYAVIKSRNNTSSYDNGEKHSKDNEDLVSILSLKPGTSIAPKFEPIGDLCRCNKCKYGNGDGIVGVVPARPGKLTPHKSRKPKSKPTTTPAPLPTYSTQSSAPAYPTPAYSTLPHSYSAPAPSYSVPTPSYTPSVPSYSAPVPSSSYSAPASSLPYGAPSYSAPASSYNAPASSYTAAAPSYITPEAASYSASVSFYNAPATTAQYAPAYQTAYSAPAPPSSTPTITPYTPDSAQYVPAYPQQPPQMIYVVGGAASPSATTTYPYVQPGYDKNKREIMAPALNFPDSTQYPRAYPQQSPQMTHQNPKATPNFEREEAKITPASYTQNSAQYVPTYAQQPVQMIYAVGDAPSAKEAYENTKAEPEYQKDYKQEGTITPVLFTPDLAQYTPTHPQQSGQIIYAAPASHNTAAPAEYVPTYQQSAAPAAPPAPESYAAEAASPTEKSSKKSKKQVDYEKDEQEAQTLVEIQLQKERTPRYTADPVSVSMAYKIIADSQGKKYVPEDSLAFGHYKEPVDGRVNKCVSNFDEEKLHTVDKPVVELKDDDYGNLQISYRDIGFGPVAPSNNRFVPKTDDVSNSPLGPTIIYVPPPEDKDGLPCGPLGPTIPGYKPGGIIHGSKTSPVQEGTRRAVLVDDDEQNSEEHEGGSDKGGIIERIKSPSCKCKKSE